MRVKVYRNLHKDCWSVVAMEGENYGRVISHESTLLMKLEKAVVSQKGRARVLQEKRKNVHAYLLGEIMEYRVIDIDSTLGFIAYNPYEMEEFQVPEGTKYAYFGCLGKVYGLGDQRNETPV